MSTLPFLSNLFSFSFLDAYYEQFDSRQGHSNSNEDYNDDSNVVIPYQPSMSTAEGMQEHRSIGSVHKARREGKKFDKSDISETQL
jgi:hypothetical protein